MSLLRIVGGFGRTTLSLSLTQTQTAFIPTVMVQIRVDEGESRKNLSVSVLEIQGFLVDSVPEEQRAALRIKLWSVATRDNSVC